jgi:resolvase-like protein
MTKVAIYARYSSDNQREASIEDQFRVCREYAKRQGWQLVESYSDEAISGPACCGRASKRFSRTRSPSGSTSARRSRSIGSAATRRTSPASISACPVRWPCRRSPRRRPHPIRQTTSQAPASGRLAARLFPGCCHGERTRVAHVVPGGLDPAVGALDVGNPELVRLCRAGTSHLLP